MQSMHLVTVIRICFFCGLPLSKILVSNFESINKTLCTFSTGDFPC